MCQRQLSTANANISLVRLERPSCLCGLAAPFALSSRLVLPLCLPEAARQIVSQIPPLQFKNYYDVAIRQANLERFQWRRIQSHTQEPHWIVIYAVWVHIRHPYMYLCVSMCNVTTDSTVFTIRGSGNAKN